MEDDMGNRYNRSEILSAGEIPDASRNHLRKEMDYLTDEEFEGEQFVRYQHELYGEKEYLPLSQFVRSHSKLWDGHYGLCAFSCYSVKIDRDQAVIAYRWW